jgi:DNA (cytosine-5)-methyltransferase 1
MGRPRLLDLFCGAGGAAVGYYRAGFEVVGIDIEPQRHYPFTFIQADALDYPLDGFDAIHASPPCQHYSRFSRNLGRAHLHPDLVAPVRARLQGSGLPYVIENVEGAPLLNPVTLCGSIFGLTIDIDGQLCHLRRHRLFESNAWLWSSGCNHKGPAISVTGHGTPLAHVQRFGRCIRVAEFRRLMDIDWMNRGELSQAIPPAYTEWLGRHLLTAIGLEVA